MMYNGNRRKRERVSECEEKEEDDDERVDGRAVITFSWPAEMSLNQEAVRGQAAAKRPKLRIPVQRLRIA
jgi:hypothetical protein